MTTTNMSKKSGLTIPEALSIIIFGASGDLTARKLIPSLYQLYANKRLPERFAIIGTARSDYDSASYREQLLPKLKEFLPEDVFDAEQAKSFLDHIHYFKLDPQKPEGYDALARYLANIDEEIGNPSNYVFYLATPPSLYGKIPVGLAAAGLNRGMTEGNKNIRRIVVEKPFGRDLESARRLNDILQAHFDEKQIYRIDHFLGKETAQNMMALRFANGIFEPLWNRNYIDRIEITAVENLGIERRGSFYEEAGALRDMVQNHLIQLLALTAMEPPAVFNANTFRDETLKVYQSLRPLRPKDIRTNVVRGQYTESTVANEHLKGYRSEKDVSPESRTETYVAMKLFIDNWRWGGVPFYIRTGKQMATKVTEIVVHFSETPYTLFQTAFGKSIPNTLTIRIQPNEGAVLKFGMKTPGAGFEVQPVSMDFSYEKVGGVPAGDAYSRLLEDCMRGDSTLFTRSDAMEASWAFFTPVLKAWQEDPTIPLYGYPARTWGPHEADELMAEGRAWTNPCKNLTDTDLYCEL